MLKNADRRPEAFWSHWIAQETLAAFEHNQYEGVVAENPFAKVGGTGFREFGCMLPEFRFPNQG